MSTHNIPSNVSSVGNEPASPSRSEDRARLASLAAEFESLLLTNVLREMRTTGRWSDGTSGGDFLGADTYSETFDVELARTLSRSGGFGLSHWLLNAFDAIERARNVAADDTISTPPPALPSTSTGGDSNTTTTARLGWNGLHLDPPAAGNSGARWGGFNVDRAMAGGDDSSVKDAFYRWTYGLNFNPAGKSKAEIGEFLRANVQSARAYGLNILDVEGEQILIETQERGLEWIDVVAQAGSPNPSDTSWQWLPLADDGVATGGGLLGEALADLRNAPGGAERARTLLTSSNLTGDELLLSLRAEVTNARNGVPTTTERTPMNASAREDLTRPSATVTSDFGWRRDPFTGATSFHRGVDLRAAEGDPVVSTGAGRVVFSGDDGGYGRSVIIEHADGVRTRYAHLSAALVSLGEQVAQGQRIGLVGQTGRATAPHLHYEVLADGRAVDPLG